MRNSLREPRRLIASYAPARAYAPRVRIALENLGYRIAAATTRGAFDDDSWEPELRIVDERYIERIPPEDYLPRTPVVLLTGDEPMPCRDRRIVGRVRRPATLADLYALLQRALEDAPRAVARTPTQLPARCTQLSRRWMGAVVSLSQQGCLFRSLEPLAADKPLSLVFPIAKGQMISARARVIGQHAQLARIVFDEIAAPSREAVARYVADRLATL